MRRESTQKEHIVCAFLEYADLFGNTAGLAAATPADSTRGHSFKPLYSDADMVRGILSLSSLLSLLTISVRVRSALEFGARFCA